MNIYCKFIIGGEGARSAQKLIELHVKESLVRAIACATLLAALAVLEPVLEPLHL